MSKNNLKINSEDLIDRKLLFGSYRRCSCCAKTYPWILLIPPLVVEESIESVPEMARFLVCSDKCLDKFLNKEVCQPVICEHQFSRILLGCRSHPPLNYVSKTGHLEDPFYGDLELSGLDFTPYLFTKIDQDHFQ